MNPKGGGEISLLLGSAASCGGSHHPCSAIMQLGSLGRCFQGSWERRRLWQDSPIPTQVAAGIFGSSSSCASLVTPNIWELLEVELIGGSHLQLTSANPAASRCPRL